MSSEVNFGAESNAVLLPAGQVRHQGELRWFHKLSWALYTFSLDVGMSVTIAFWAILRTEFDAFSWHCHAINSVALIMDLIVSGTVSSRPWSLGSSMDRGDDRAVDGEQNEIDKLLKRHSN